MFKRKITFEQVRRSRRHEVICMAFSESVYILSVYALKRFLLVDESVKIKIATCSSLYIIRLCVTHVRAGARGDM